MSRPYRPSNGTEGIGFMECYCFRCWWDRNEDCPTLADTLAHGVDEQGYPPEWVQDDNGRNQRCTRFRDIERGSPRELPWEAAQQLHLSFE